MTHEQYVTVSEAARILGVHKEKVARLVKSGVLTSRKSVIDARRRLIPLTQVEAILREDGKSFPGTADEDTEKSRNQRPWPKSIGIVSDGSLQSEDIEEYLKEHWRPEC